MNREIKFRGFSKSENKWFYGFLTFNKESGKAWIGSFAFGNYYFVEVAPESVGQFTGLHDKNGVEIYEKGIVEYKSVEIEYQTHTGDNIPNGSYTEPIGIMLKTTTAIVEYELGSFVLVNEDTNEKIPIQYSFNSENGKLFEYTEDCILRGIDTKRNRGIFDDDYSDEKESLDYLLEELGMTLNELIEDCKMKVIGNVYQNPELINK